jgi:predicted phage-related endonuclease
MKILNLVQGSAEWKEVRTKYCVASEAPVIMGASPHMKRDELLRLKSSGLEREFSEWVEKFILKRGHEVEALARPVAEARLGDDLYQLIGVNEVAGLQLLASYDGMTAPMHEIHWEHKQYNQELFVLVQSGGELEGKHYWQLEHQLLVNGNDSCIFAVSDGTAENYAELIYQSRPDRRASLIEGWKLFLIDLHNYVQPEALPVVVGEVIKDFPALVIEIVGEVKSSNLALYQRNVVDFIRNIKTDLQDDQDFANAETIHKFLGEKEKELELIERQVISQASSVDEAIRTIKALKEEMRQKRLQLEKLVETEKQSRKNEIIISARSAWLEHMKACNDALKTVRMPDIPVDFVAASKSKRTIETFRSAVNDELARAKIEANRIANHIDVNLGWLRNTASKHMFLFADIQALVLKDLASLEAIAKVRISEHEAAEQARIQTEAKRIADEQLAKERAQETAPTPIQLGNETLNQQFNEVFADHKPAPKKTIHNSFQTGIIYGLDLALAIYIKHGANGFTKAVEDFIESDCLPEAPKPKVAA